MILIVGLGNPEERYRFTRHNIGFVVVDAFAKKNNFLAFIYDKKSNTLITEQSIEQQNIILAKPQTFMNQSGRAVASLYQRYQIRDFILGTAGKTEIQGRHFQDQIGLLVDPVKLLRKSKSILKPFGLRQRVAGFRYMIVIHDDIDLPLGRIKISVGSGSAGHKGVESIIRSIGTQDFVRIRVGIQPIEGKPPEVEQFVLKKFSEAEAHTLEEVIQNSSAAIETIISSSVEQAMQDWN
ncbi:MAG: peptidyl-tRNA hydrolase [Candidatus Wildermuthbacteria bacterium]|nr:peptidyl-tRNA hydrolase [Candidatus Wildermuthbacteria bacterium]